MKRAVRTINCGIVSGQHCNALKWPTSRKALFYEMRSKIELQCIFSAVSSVPFLAEFKRRYSDTITIFQESMFYKKRLEIIDYSCYAP